MIPKIRLFAGSSLLLISLFVVAQTNSFPPWLVPEDAENVENPIPIDKKTIGEGMAFYNINCKACHGENANGKGVIPAGDLLSLETQSQTDAELFYKIQEGRGQMPGFHMMKETDLWHVINYIGSLIGEQEEIICKNAIVKMVFREDDKLNQITATVYEITNDSTEIPAKDIKVNMYIKRYFGDLLINPEKHYTDENGMLTVEFPEGIPGKDEELTIIVRVEDMEYNPVEISRTVKWGVQKETYWTEARALWKNNDYVPMWLLISFIAIVGGVWLVIIFVMLQLKKIHNLNRK